MTVIYLDMDEVVADFSSYANRVLNKKSQAEGRYPENEWQKLKSNPRIYRDLDPTTYAHHLVDHCKRICHDYSYQLRFLTAVPKNNDVYWVFHDKIYWAMRHFPDVPVMFGPYSYDKKKHCNPGDILVDDRTSNINEWNEVGGIGILHKGDVIDTINKLNQALNI